jgi:glutaredoxin-dependent peroxiredoxin
MSKLGTTAPNFTLPNHKKEQVSLEGLRGKKVVLAFFPAAFTKVCEKELCTFRDSLANFNNTNATVLGISVDAPFSNAAFVEKNNLNFPVLSDYARTAVNAYGIAHNDFAGLTGYTASKRAVFVVDTTGKVSYEWVAESPGNEPDYAAVKAAVDSAS